MCISKFRKVQCFNNSSDYVLTQSAGRHILTTGLSDQGVITQQTMTCTDSENLLITLLSRPVRPLDFIPHTVEIALEAKLLYPDVAFGSDGQDGVVYKRINFEEFELFVYEDGKDYVLEMQRNFNSGDEVDDLDFKPDPEEWNEVGNIVDYFVDCLTR